MPAPTEAARPTRKASQTVLGCKSGGKHRSESGYRAVHQARESWLYDLQHEEPPLDILFFLLDGGSDRLLERLGGCIVAALDFGEVSEQLTDA